MTMTAIGARMLMSMRPGFISGVRDVAPGFSIELRFAAGRAKEVCLSSIRGVVFGCGGMDEHAANRILPLLCFIRAGVLVIHVLLHHGDLSVQLYTPARIAPARKRARAVSRPASSQ